MHQSDSIAWRMVSSTAKPNSQQGKRIWGRISVLKKGGIEEIVNLLQETEVRLASGYTLFINFESAHSRIAFRHRIVHLRRKKGHELELVNKWKRGKKKVMKNAHPTLGLCGKLCWGLSHVYNSWCYKHGCFKLCFKLNSQKWKKIIILLE